MYNLNDFVCCIPQMKQEFWANFHQLTKFPTNIDRQTTLWAICFHVQLISKQITHHIFAVDWDIWQVNWVAPCSLVAYGSGTRAGSRIKTRNFKPRFLPRVPQVAASDIVSKRIVSKPQSHSFELCETPLWTAWTAIKIPITVTTITMK